MSAFWENLPHPHTAVCVGAPGEQPLKHSALVELVNAARQTLHHNEIGAEQRVALLLPHGATAATAFLALGASTAVAPLNPAYRAEELHAALEDLQPRALVVQKPAAEDATSRALSDTGRSVAAQLGISTLELQPQPERGTGSFILVAESAAQLSGKRPRLPGAADTALLLHTSGTTAKPKLVPLSHANLRASAGHIATALQLTPSDRCLAIMPLFHIHGLVGCVLAALHAGGAVFCVPGFNALRMLAWLEAVQPTWYSAVPTMHQAILARLGSQAERLRQLPLRFVRASSASLPPQVMRDMEALLGVPVIESYGMTEAAHQMASNPLPPKPRKAGSVGLPAGPEVAIMGSNAAILTAGAEGEVVVRGPNVMDGYCDNPTANAAAFINGWFRTGDQGRFDADGYLFLTGRIKELINRGGEKISPLEVDAVLLEHPAVAYAAAFGLPHAKLGEEVAAAVVLRDGSAIDEAQLRAFVATRLAPFKVPRRIVFVAAIPKGPTGKLQRQALPRLLELA